MVSVLWLIRLVVCLAVLFGLPVCAQNVQNPQSSVDHRMRSDLKVDPSTGVMQLQIPLGEFRGRGEANLPVVLNYSSKVWTIKHYSTQPCNGEPVSAYRAEYAKASASGWTSTVGWLLSDEDTSFERYDSSGNPVPPPSPASYRIMRKFIRLPDGSRHEVRRDDIVHDLNAGQSGVYYAVDGSRIWYDTVTDTVFMPNGSRILNYGSGRVQGNPPTQIVDRNGNFLTFDATSSTWNDTLNRTIAVPFGGDAPSAGNFDYTLPGGLTYTLRWRNLADARTDPNQALRFKGDTKPPINCSTGGFQPNHLFSSVNGGHWLREDGPVFNPVVLWQISLPNGTNYTFTYNVYGEMDKIVYPTGGTEQFTHGVWEPLGGQLDDGTYLQGNRGVTARSVSDGLNNPQVWTYGGTVFEQGVDPATRGRSTTAPNGTVTKTWYYKSKGDQIKYGFDEVRTGMEREVRVYDSAGTMLRRTIYEVVRDGALPGGWSTATRNGRVNKTVEIILDTGGNALASTTEMTYDADLNVIRTKHYDFVEISQATAQTADHGAIPNGTLLRTQETDFLTSDSNYRARNLLSLPIAMRFKNGSGTIVAQSSIAYDETSFPLLTYGAVTGWTDLGTNVRGNATTTSSWLNTTGTNLSSHVQYDQCGNVRKVWDARDTSLSNPSQIEYSATHHRAYPTLNTSADPDGGGPLTALVTSTEYDGTTGLVTSTTDANGQQTTFSYNDPLLRLKQVIRAAGDPSVKNQTIYTYDDQGRTVTVESDLNAFNDKALKTITVYDALGRTIENKTFEDATNYISVQTQYDTSGRPHKTSSPFRPLLGESLIWTTTTFDALGRVKTVTTPDSAVVTTDYSGNKVTATDQAGKQRKSVSDALGRLKEVYEAPNDSNFNYLTSYAYDALDNLTSVTQGSQSPRSFVYDSLKRLTSATNPESGTVAYQYDNNGNLVVKTEARSVSAHLEYDALNRVTRRWYNGSSSVLATTHNSPALPSGVGASDQANFFYDSQLLPSGAPTYSRGSSLGRLVAQTYGVGSSTGSYFAYDQLGRVTIKYQRTGTVNYLLSASYNRAGGVTSQTYPSGRAVSYGYDNAGRLSSFTGNLGDGVNRNYSTGIVYSTFGGMTKEQFGTDTPLYNKAFYNSRGQLAEIRVGTTYTGPTDSSWNRGAIINRYSECWGACGGTNSTTPMTDNNGNLQKQEMYIPNNDQLPPTSWTLWWQQYDYDALNRLRWVEEVNPGLVWKQEFIYDRWGNRTIHQTNTWGTGIPKPNFGVNASNNRLTAPIGFTMTYDAAGNQTADTYTGPGLREYDAENKMTKAQGWSGQWQEYTYDGDGQRVRRKVDGVETWQIHGVGGELLVEYAAGGAPTSPQKEYGYRNGQLLVTAEPGPSLIFSDDFNDNALDPSKWTIESPASPVVVSETGQRLQLTVPPNTAGYNGVRTNSTFDITNKSVQVELVQPISQAGWCENFLQVGLDANNYFMIDVGGSSMVLRSRVGGVNDQTIIPAFDPVAHRHWRIRHNQGNNTVTFDTSPDATNWTTRKTVTVPFSLTALKFYLYAGAWGTGNSSPGAAKYDNFQLVSNSGLTANVQWLVSDQLGTPRLVFDKTGSLATTKRHDYLPFGEELFAGTGARTTQQGYSQPDGVRQGFTGYEKDGETGLNFAQARYQSPTQGRFTSADAYVIFFEMKRGRNARERAGMLRAYVSEPQNWNRYSYCINDPVNLIDPSGLIWLTKDNENYQWVDDDKYRKEDWEGYSEADAGTIAYFGEGWGGYQDKYKGLMGGYVTLNADGSLSSAGISDVDEVNDPPSSSGYGDINIGYGSPYFIGITGGLMFDRNGTYPYIGGGFMNPGLSGSVTGSNDNVSGGFNAELQGGYGPLYGSVGTDQEGNTFLTHGAGYGASATAYYVFGAPHPRPGPHRPTDNNALNSNSNRRGTGRPGRSNCACNSN